MREVELGENFSSVLGAAQAGAEWAMALLFRQYQPKLLRYTRHAGQDGEDVAAATWVDAARNLNAFDGDEEYFRRWLFTIANRRLTDHLRRVGRRSEQLVAEMPDPPSHAPDAGEAAIAGLAGDIAARRIAATLPPDQAAVVLLRVIGGFDVDEVAEVLGKRPGAVRVLAHRGLKRLAREFGDEV